MFWEHIIGHHSVLWGWQTLGPASTHLRGCHLFQPVRTQQIETARPGNQSCSPPCECSPFGPCAFPRRVAALLVPSGSTCIHAYIHTCIHAYIYVFNAHLHRSGGDPRPCCKFGQPIAEHHGEPWPHKRGNGSSDNGAWHTGTSGKVSLHASAICTRACDSQHTYRSPHTFPQACMPRNEKEDIEVEP